MFVFCLKKPHNNNQPLCCLWANVNEYRMIPSSRCYSQTNQISGYSGDYRDELSNVRSGSIAGHPCGIVSMGFPWKGGWLTGGERRDWDWYEGPISLLFH